MCVKQAFGFISGMLQHPSQSSGFRVQHLFLHGYVLCKDLMSFDSFSSLGDHQLAVYSSQNIRTATLLFHNKMNTVQFVRHTFPKNKSQQGGLQGTLAQF